MPTPPRRFDPTPVEQTSKSSRQTEQQPIESNKKPRRFAPEPVEETVRSSKDVRPPHVEQKEDKPQPRRFAPQPVEETARSSKDVRPQLVEQKEDKPKPRRFAPQPVEQSATSSKDVPQQYQTAKKDIPKSRRFAPQVVEETHKSSKEKSEPEHKPHVKFKPEPVSVTYGHSKKNLHKEKPATEDQDNKPAPRKFTPILLDTASRSRRTGDLNTPLHEKHKTEYGYHAHSPEHWRRVNGQPDLEPAVEPDPGPASVIDEGESDRTSSMSSNSSLQMRKQCSLDGSAPKTRSACLLPTRQHSFRMPELDTIESSESEEESNPPSPRSLSPSRGGSPITASDSSFDNNFKHATRRRESIDEDFTHYLLDLERKKAQQRLEEQALAAYPNADFGYEPPAHYLEDDDSDDMEIEDRPVTWEGHEEDFFDKPRRDSTARTPWEQIEMQKHAEQLQQERNAAKTTAKAATKSPWWKSPEAGKDEDEADSELKSMRDRARPPMLGGDLVFPRCPSPQPARFDVTQGSAALRNQMCYLTEQSENEKTRVGEEGGLWRVPQASAKPVSTVMSSPSSAKTPSTKGLWGGFCVDDGEKKASSGLAPAAGPTGIMTPKVETPNPYDSMFTEDRPISAQTPPTPPRSLKEADLGHIDSTLVKERELDAMAEREFPDEFITQVYNYLSLGYPSLARPFDEELSKISRIPMADLRQDDVKARASPRGYIRLGTDFEGGGGEGMTEESCMRWQALKLYIREWAKQEKNMVKGDDIGELFGAGARRGSWAI